ncbi:MAG: amidase [Gemmatimonadota bacterium]|nr:amidase [Gemmatimonadota bacterium]
MQGFADYDKYDGLGLAGLVRSREVSAAELVEEAIRRAEVENPRLNAIVTPLYARARQEAAGSLPEGPFCGVPFLLKDILQHLEGVPTMHGSAALRDFVPDRDATVVRRFRDAGVVIMGKTNVPELGLMGVTEPEAFGATRNPWDTKRTPGGSSGGAAAAVAAGIVPLAGANDGGGSIRIPASHCALFGLKPTRGRVPLGPYAGEVWEGASIDHVLSRSVRDSAAMLDCIAGADAGAPYASPARERPYMQELGESPGRLRVALCVRSPLGGAVHPECVKAARDAAHLLEGLGHDVEEAEPEVDGQDLARSYFTLYLGQVSATARWIRQEKGKERVAEMELTTRALARVGESLSAARYVAAKWRWNDFARAMARFHERYDIYLTPTVAVPPPRIGELSPAFLERIQLLAAATLPLSRVVNLEKLIDRLAREHLASTPFTQLANFTGQPAMTVPLHWTPEGLPVGVQITAPFAAEGLLFRVASQLEKARPWWNRRPPVAPSPPV